MTPERRFRRAEAHVEEKLAETQRSWNVVGLVCLALFAFAALCLWVRYGL